MDDSEFPDEFNLRFRSHALFVHIRSTLDFAREIATEGRDHLAQAEVKLFEDLATELERAWIDAEKIKRRVQSHLSIEAKD